LTGFRTPSTMDLFQRRPATCGVGSDVIAALTKSITLAVGYGYGFDAPRPGHNGAQEGHLLLEKKF